jgi:histone H4
MSDSSSITIHEASLTDVSTCASTNTCSNTNTTTSPTRKGMMSHRKRHNTPRNDIHGITKSAIRRLARRGGVKMISSGIYEETRKILKEFLTLIIRDAVTHTEHARRITVGAMDVLYALKQQGRTLYGYD